MYTGFAAMSFKNNIADAFFFLEMVSLFLLSHYQPHPSPSHHLIFSLSKESYI